MGWASIPFQILTADIDEISDCKNPSDIVMDLAMQKAQAVYAKGQEQNCLILAADTIVVLDNQILGKPKDNDDARKLLSMLSDRTHQVLTGVCLLHGSRIHSFYQSTMVTFRHITEDQMQIYLKTGESLDKAGAYGIQGAALAFIEKLDGSYSNVVGLPIDQVIVEIKNFLGYAGDSQGEWRKCFIDS